jgi:hypothetical protein
MSLSVRQAIRLPIFAQQVTAPATQRPDADRMVHRTSIRRESYSSPQVLPLRAEPPPAASTNAAQVVGAYVATQTASVTAASSQTSAAVVASSNPNVVYSYLPTDAELAAAADKLRADLQATKDWAALRYAVLEAAGDCTPQQLAELRVELDRQVREAEAQYERAMNELGALGIARFNANADAAIAATNERQATHAALLASAKEKAIADLRAASIAESAIPQILQQLESEFYHQITVALETNATLTSFNPQCVIDVIASHMSAMRADMANTGITEAEWRRRQRPEGP